MEQKVRALYGTRELKNTHTPRTQENTIIQSSSNRAKAALIPDFSLLKHQSVEFFCYKC